MDEEAVLLAASAFISQELDLQTIEVVVGESDDDTTGRAGSAMPLSPNVIYA